MSGLAIYIRAFILSVTIQYAEYIYLAETDKLPRQDSHPLDRIFCWLHDPVGFSFPHHCGYENSACSLMNSFGLRHDEYFEAQSVRFRYGSTSPASRTMQSVTHLHVRLGVGLVVSLCLSWTPCLLTDRSPTRPNTLLGTLMLLHPDRN
jgi:hypothetical protein